MALRALKTDQEIAGIPLDQPILIELPGTVIEDDGSVGTVADKPAKTEPLDGAKVLQDQLEAAQRAQAASDARTEKAERDAAEALRLVAEVEKRNAALEGDVITGGLAAAQNELAAAEAELERAGEAGDFKAMAKAQTRIGRASAQIIGYEAGAAEIADRPKPEARQEQTLQRAPDFATQVRSNPNLLRSEQDWMIKNKDAFSDPDFNKKLDFAYAGAVQQGKLVRGSQAYFDYIERATGLVAGDNDDNQGSRDVQAPPSRNERGNDGAIPTKFNYDPDTRAFIRSLGITEKEYAMNEQRFLREKKADPEKYGNR